MEEQLYKTISQNEPKLEKLESENGQLTKFPFQVDILIPQHPSYLDKDNILIS